MIAFILLLLHSNYLRLIDYDVEGRHRKKTQKNNATVGELNVVFSIHVFFVFRVTKMLKMISDGYGEDESKVAARGALKH